MQYTRANLQKIYRDTDMLQSLRTLVQLADAYIYTLPHGIHMAWPLAGLGISRAHACTLCHDHHLCYSLRRVHKKGPRNASIRRWVRATMWHNKRPFRDQPSPVSTVATATSGHLFPSNMHLGGLLLLEASSGSGYKLEDRNPGSVREWVHGTGPVHGT